MQHAHQMQTWSSSNVLRARQQPLSSHDGISNLNRRQQDLASARRFERAEIYASS